LVDLGNPDHLEIHISRIRNGWTWDGIPTTSFTDSYDPDYTTFYRFDLNSPMSPSSYTFLSASD